jgi:hypothetical protein
MDTKAPPRATLATLARHDLTVVSWRGRHQVTIDSKYLQAVTMSRSCSRWSYRWQGGRNVQGCDHPRYTAVDIQSTHSATQLPVVDIQTTTSQWEEALEDLIDSFQDTIWGAHHSLQYPSPVPPPTRSTQLTPSTTTTGPPRWLSWLVKMTDRALVVSSPGWDMVPERPTETKQHELLSASDPASTARPTQDEKLVVPSLLVPGLVARCYQIACGVTTVTVNWEQPTLALALPSWLAAFLLGDTDSRHIQSIEAEMVTKWPQADDRLLPTWDWFHRVVGECHRVYHYMTTTAFTTAPIRCHQTELVAWWMRNHPSGHPSNQVITPGVNTVNTIDQAWLMSTSLRMNVMLSVLQSQFPLDQDCTQ